MAIDPEDLTSGDKAHLVRRGEPADVVGHGENKGFRATVDEESIFIEWGATVKVSSHTTPPGNADKSPPLVHMTLAGELARNKQLKQVE